MICSVGESLCDPLELIPKGFTPRDIPSKPKPKDTGTIYTPSEELLAISSSRIFHPFPSWLSSRSISKCQLNTLLCLHLIPIYLVLFKGSFERVSTLLDISS